MYSGEKFNSITHLVGAVLALIGLGSLLTIGLQQENLIILFSFMVFGLMLVILYTMSTLYHSFHPPKLKKIFQQLDHISIYLLIAGTYTPFMLVSLGDGNGPLMLSFVWGLAILGILLDLFIKKRIEALQIIIYLMMGWVCTLEWDNLKDAITAAGVFWLVSGGIFYTIGVTFYVLDHKKKLRHAHGIWHLFVLSGSVSHFISIIAYVR